MTEYVKALPLCLLEGSDK